MCETRILSHKGVVVISQCTDCKAIYIWHQNLILNFTKAQFTEFKHFAFKMDFDEHTLPFPDGEERLVLRTPNNDINFTFTLDEWHNFQSAMEDAAYMAEVYGMVDN